ncbi:hypothetical protein CEP54_005650 [Fusarium duplospermum]|uniref:Uncharacterized protein n=1 Tax=Fusarium duplospermum TaxID=1325734 RepID=A0A428QB68_9HYPO|nr:hypothetical protein CEP54_005650 [Fusarium duplospermum]
MSPTTTCEVRSEEGAFRVIILLGAVALVPLSNFLPLFDGRYRVKQALKKLSAYRDPDARLHEYYKMTEVRATLYGFILYIAYIVSCIAICISYGDGMTRSERIAFSGGFGLAGFSICIVTFSIKRNADYYADCLDKEIEHLRSSACERECKGQRRSRIEQK